MFNQHFSLSFSPHSTLLSGPDHTPPSKEILNPITFTIPLIASHIKHLKSSYIPGPEGISPNLLKHGGTDIPLLLMNLFNLSMKYGTVPDAWKLSVVIPRHKKGSRYTVENYRPINHTSIILRIMERIVKSSLTNFLNTIQFPFVNQHGFLNSRSCSTCHNDFFNHVTTSIDSGCALIVIYLDLMKAFDKVPHSLLLQKLKNIGFGQQLSDWFSSYFHGRSQVVKIGPCYSKHSPITSGVIQGSVIGPLLFLIYINDLFPSRFNGTPFLYADDIKIVYSFRPPFSTDWLRVIQSDLNSLDAWCSKWHMQFTTSKCAVLSFGCSFPPNRLMLHGSYIPLQSNVSNLLASNSASHQ